MLEAVLIGLGLAAVIGSFKFFRRSEAQVTASQRPASHPAPPGPTHSEPEVWLRFRPRGSETEVEDLVRILRIDGKQDGDAVKLTAVVGWSDAEDRERRYAINTITGITVDGEDVEGRSAVMHWLRCKAGIATEAENLDAGLAAAEAEAAEGGQLLAQRLRLPAWIRYADRNGELTERQITISAIGGSRLDEGDPAIFSVYAYCHLRRAARHFHVDRITQIADTDAELQQAPCDDAETWLLQRVQFDTATQRPAKTRRSRN